MRFAFSSVAALTWVCLACGAAIPTSNSAKMGEALAFAAIAGAAQVAQSAIERNARNNAPVTHAGGGVRAAPDCDNEGQYGCVSVSAEPNGPGSAPEAEMDVDEARDYVLGYVNGVRKLNAVAPVARDETLDAFAQAGSEQLSQDHKPNAHMTEHARELRVASAENQGSPEGSRPGPLQDQIAAILLGMMAEGAGGMHHDAMLRPDWRKLGVGIVQRGGRMYFTVDLSS
jgi:uncharacterized protein YkwD